MRKKDAHEESDNSRASANYTHLHPGSVTTISTAIGGAALGSLIPGAGMVLGMVVGGVAGALIGSRVEEDIQTKKEETSS